MSGLAEASLQRIATDLGFSETIFLDWQEPETPRVRIFTPGTEIPFAGHPLVGLTYVLNVLGPGGVSRVTCGVGEVEIRVVGDECWIHPPGGQPVGECHLVLDTEAIDSRTVLMPVPYHVFHLADPALVAEMDPPSHPDDVYVWAWKEKDRTVKARFFGPTVGVPEDPATGSAAVALAAVLTNDGMHQGELSVEQGDEVGFPSTIRLRWGEGAVEVGGRVMLDEVRQLDL
jgi:trans-2,3-dihydro-3-hydroxyanthranilate isomerase